MQTAREIMTSNVVTIEATASVADALALMQQKHLRDLIVSPENEADCHGIVTEADIVYKVAAQGTDPATVKVADIMTKPCIELDPDLSVQEVASLFSNHHIHRAPVVKDKLLGVVTAFDIVRETMWWQG